MNAWYEVIDWSHWLIWSYAPAVFAGILLLAIGFFGRVRWGAIVCKNCKDILSDLDPAKHQVCPNCKRPLSPTHGYKIARGINLKILAIAFIILTVPWLSVMTYGTLMYPIKNPKTLKQLFSELDTPTLVMQIPTYFYEQSLWAEMNRRIEQKQVTATQLTPVIAEIMKRIQLEPDILGIDYIANTLSIAYDQQLVDPKVISQMTKRIAVNPQIEGMYSHYGGLYSSLHSHLEYDDRYYLLGTNAWKSNFKLYCTVSALRVNQIDCKILKNDPTGGCVFKATQTLSEGEAVVEVDWTFHLLPRDLTYGFGHSCDEKDLVGAIDTWQFTSRSKWNLVGHKHGHHIHFEEQTPEIEPTEK